MVLNMKILFVILLIFIKCNSVIANDFEKLNSIENTVYHELHSKVLNKTYHIHVKAPKPLKEKTKYITVYLLDGDITFPLLASYSKYLNLAEDIPDIILVGISYGTDDFKKGNSRGHDFTAPANGRAHYGGAEKFQSMLNQELFPMIEKNYPSDKQKRILFGQSLGGQFALFNTMYHPKNFWGVIASNPAIHRNLEFFKGTPFDNKKPGLLYVSRAKNDEARYIQPLNEWLSYWNEKTHPWSMKVAWLEDHNHFSAAPDAFRNGMRWIMKQ